MPPRNRIQLDVSFHRITINIIFIIINDINDDVVNDLELSQRQRSDSLGVYFIISQQVLFLKSDDRYIDFFLMSK